MPCLWWPLAWCKQTGLTPTQHDTHQGVLQDRLKGGGGHSMASDERGEGSISTAHQRQHVPPPSPSRREVALLGLCSACCAHRAPHAAPRFKFSQHSLPVCLHDTRLAPGRCERRRGVRKGVRRCAAGC
jgi:hypothetical protein